jgi:hypothetical protein
MTRSNAVRGLVIVTFASHIAQAGVARAQTSEQNDWRARALFAEGRTLAARGDYAAACQRFEASYRIDPGIGTNFNLADCLEHIGRTASAWARFVEVETATHLAGQVRREEVARARAAALEPRLSRLEIQVAPSTVGIVIHRDGALVPAEKWGVVVPVDPGDHTIDASAPDKRPWSTKIVVSQALDLVIVTVPELADAAGPLSATAAGPTATTAAGQTKTAAAGPPKIAAASSPYTAVADPPNTAAADTHPANVALGVQSAPEVYKLSWSRAPHATIWLGAVGIAALAAGTVFALKFQGERDEADTLCQPANMCKDTAEKTTYENLYQAATRDRVISFATAGTGVVALAAAMYLWWRAPRGGDAPRRVAFSADHVGRGGGALVIGWGW